MKKLTILYRLVLPMAPICPGAICPYVELIHLAIKPKGGHSSKQEINASVGNELDSYQLD